MTAVYKKLTLDLEGIPENRIRSAKKAVLNVIENEISRSLAKGRSPVKGEVFPKLDDDYADDQKQGNRTPNLQLEGDMLEAVEYDVLSGDQIGFGFKEGNSQIDKADGHNQFSADSKKAIWNNGAKKLPKRRFIPEENQSFKPSTQKLIDLELNKFRSVNRSTEQALQDNIVGDSVQELNFGGNLFSEETIVSELLREISLNGS